MEGVDVGEWRGHTEIRKGGWFLILDDGIVTNEYVIGSVPDTSQAYPETE